MHYRIKVVDRNNICFKQIIAPPIYGIFRDFPETTAVNHLIFSYVKKERKKPFLSFELFKDFGNAIFYLKEGVRILNFLDMSLYRLKKSNRNLLVTRSYLVRNIVQTLFDMKKSNH